ncbi:hypothetical protein [Aeromonas sobria]|jgi:hypothetical protein|uniref:hypothetical protein n=1 Tax=Aeromonas sobria TaxID=646 RepID=UPI000C6ECB9E|nr:hypothetical protein [Aeromonas sobria]
MDVLSHKILFRPGTNSGGATTQERRSVDFTVNGTSLLSTIVKIDGGHADFMGCLVHGFPKQNAQAVERFTCAASPDSESGRILLYICPECGDIGCGAYSAFIEHGGGTYVWRDFAYENGYEDPRPILGVGPYTFETKQYEIEVYRASAL